MQFSLIKYFDIKFYCFTLPTHGATVYSETNLSVIVNTSLYQFYTDRCLPVVSEETAVLHQWGEI